MDINHNYFMDPLFMYQPIRRSGNKIYFYADVDHYSQMALIQLLNDTQADIISENAEYIINGSCPEKIELHICSYGGYLSAGLALYDFIKSLQVPTVGIVDGVAMSAATLILLACDERQMGDNSSVLIHQLSSGGMVGTYEQMNDEKHNVDNAMAKLRKIYIEETHIGLTKENLEFGQTLFEKNHEEAEEFFESLLDDRLETLNSLLKHDLELTKKECEDFGIIDVDDKDMIEFDEEDQMKLHEFVEKLMKQKTKNKNKKEKEKEEPNTKKTKKKSSD